MRYFDRYKTAETVTKRYRQLAKRHHPDLGGESAVMTDINGQYQEALRRIAALQARREADNTEAGYHMPNARKSQHRRSQHGDFSADRDKTVMNDANHQKNKNDLQSRKINDETEPQYEAMADFEAATSSVIRAGAKLFGEMAIRWVSDKINRS